MEHREDKISREELKKRIKAVFGTEKECADLLNIKKANFSNMLIKRSKSFLKKLESVGVDVSIDKQKNDDIQKELVELKAKIYDLNQQLINKDLKIEELEGKLLVRFALAGELDKKLKK